MKKTSDVLISIQKMNKFYDLCLDDVRIKYNLSKIELQIISFLHNNPGQDTVAQIASMRMLSKGNVSRGVDLLIQKELIEKRIDDDDHRWVHLTLTSKTKFITQDIDLGMSSFFNQVFQGFSQEDFEMYDSLYERMNRNVTEGLCKEEK